ncbi:hypothetical protein QYE76_064542 [Lolium multiflorum]|uniref:Arabidopsis retrotransposon Orf1 C-terminal domain-containing protein n=1 Tax=Lolium multiflorum TaxID=4521 RepID=A0AAD8S9E3_LOLMU|nr:hypothetical protein QYE76_064542 [Lolium multiflorum]
MWWPLGRPPTPPSDYLLVFETHREKSTSRNPPEPPHRETPSRSRSLRYGTTDGELEEIFTAITANASPSTSNVSPIHKGKMKKFKFGELFKKATTSTGRPSRASTQIRRSYNEDVIAPSFAPEEDHGAPNASSFPCYEFLTNAGILDDFFTLVNRAGLATYVGDERGQYYRLTKVFVESFKFHNTEYEPTVAFKIYDIPVTMKLEEFCFALGIAPVGTARRIDDNPRDLLELYRGITGDDCRTIQRGKIRNIQLPAIKYFAYYISTSILGRENTSNISSYHLAFLNVALTGETPYHLGSLIARRLSSRGPIFGGTIALRILTHLDIPLDSNDVPLTPRKLDIAAMKSHRFVTTNSTIDNIVYKMLFADGNEKEIPLPQQGLFNIDRQSWSLTKEVVEEHMKIQEFHQQHDSENAEPSYDYTVTYPDVSSSTYMEPETKRGIIHTFPTRYRSGGTPDPASARDREALRAVARGTGASRSPSHSRLYRVGRRCPPVGFDANTFRHARWDNLQRQSSTTTTSPSTSEMAEETPVTYEDLAGKLKKKHDKV